MSDLSFSVVVNTYNRGSSIGHTLRGLMALDYPSFEVIVVNGPSTDDTEARLAAWSDRIKLGTCAEKNLSISRNVGISLAAGDIIAFIDDDAVPHPMWLTALARNYREAHIGGVGGFTIDNTGARFQVRKTLCDRFGNAHNVSPYFDERPLNRPGSPFYPSLLGTNSSFRATALREIGGFDDTFAYFLDETDVCLRLVDAGHHIVYEPEALVFHQFAASHIRNTNRVPRTLYPSAVSKSYFIQRHGQAAFPFRATQELRRFDSNIRASNQGLALGGNVTAEHAASLDADIGWGIREGSERARRNAGHPGGSLDATAEPPAFRAVAPRQGLRIAFISRGYPPNQDAGIARWTKMMAEGMAARGHEVHVIAEAADTPSTEYSDGVWLHRISAEGIDASALTERFDIPTGIARWAVSARSYLRDLASFGVDVVSSPIWDVEGIGCLDGSLPHVVSLHTTYALAKPFKPEWSERPVFEHMHVRRVIKSEIEVMRRAPVLLGNSNAVVSDIEAAYPLEIKGKTIVSAHGTEGHRSGPNGANGAKKGLSVLFVGRFERRKGFDLAARSLLDLMEARSDATCVLAGDRPASEAMAMLREVEATALLDHPRAAWPGQVDRDHLERLYGACDVVLFPSRYESFGLVAIEAFAAGKPVVALSVGGVREVVTNGETGFLIEDGPKAAKQLTAALTSLANDPRRLAKMSAQAAEAFNATFTVDQMVERSEAAYKRAIELAADLEGVHADQR